MMHAIPTALFLLSAALPLTAQGDPVVDLTKQQVEAAEELAKISRAHVERVRLQTRQGTVSQSEMRAIEIAALRAELVEFEHRRELHRLTQAGKGKKARQALRTLLEARVRIAREITAALETEAESVAALIAGGRAGADAAYRSKKALLEARLVELGCRKDLAQANRGAAPK